MSDRDPMSVDAVRQAAVLAPADLHAQVLARLDELDRDARTWQRTHQRGFLFGGAAVAHVAGRRMLVERHAPVLVDAVLVQIPHTPPIYFATWALFAHAYPRVQVTVCAEHQRTAGSRLSAAAWPCPDYRDATAGLLEVAAVELGWAA